MRGGGGRGLVGRVVYCTLVRLLLVQLFAIFLSASCMYIVSQFLDTLRQDGSHVHRTLHLGHNLKNARQVADPLLLSTNACVHAMHVPTDDVGPDSSTSSSCVWVFDVSAVCFSHIHFFSSVLYIVQSVLTNTTSHSPPVELGIAFNFRSELKLLKRHLPTTYHYTCTVQHTSFTYQQDQKTLRLPHGTLCGYGVHVDLHHHSTAIARGAHTRREFRSAVRHRPRPGAEEKTALSVSIALAIMEHRPGRYSRTHGRLSRGSWEEVGDGGDVRSSKRRLEACT